MAKKDDKRSEGTAPNEATEEGTTEKAPIVVQADDSSEEARLFAITERLFDDLSKNPKFNMTQVGSLSINIPGGHDITIAKENVEKMTVLHLLFKKLIENESESVQKQYRHEFGHKIGKLVQSAGDPTLDVHEVVKEMFKKLPPEKRVNKPPEAPRAT